MPKRFDFHIHSLLTEGELVPSEIAQRCSILGYGGIAITDHVDQSNLEYVLGCLVPACSELEDNFGLKVLPGVELTHVHPRSLEKLVKLAREKGARVIAVHGETIVEPVLPGTNNAALTISDVNMLAHPGLISSADVQLAKDNDVFLELTSRKGHSLSNGHIAKASTDVGARMLLNSDAHSPGDLISYEDAWKIAKGCGLSEHEAKIVLEENPKILLKTVS